MNADPDDIGEARMALTQAWLRLHTAMKRNCPGPHEWAITTVAPRGYAEAWCPRCRRTADGELVEPIDNRQPLDNPSSV